jgi:nucleoside-diphosphate-sugar epimerase
MILVTGGTGLLGSHLLFQLSHDNEPIRSIYRDQERIGQVESLFKFYSPENYSFLFKKIEWIQADILDSVSLNNAFKEIDIVYHCAGLVSFSKRHFNQLIKINREGTANIVNTCLEFKVKKLCYVSSTASIGGQSGEITTEATKWKQSPETNGYSISKYSGEKEVWRGVEEGLDCIIVNPSVIFGAGNWDESSLTIFRTVQNGLRFYTSGQNGFVDARDVAHIMVQLTNSKIKNERYLCVGNNIPFKVLMEKIALKLEKKPPTINTPKWLTGLVWRLTWFFSLFSRKDAMLTKASSRSAFNFMTYDSSKVIEQLSFKFRTIDETIENTIKGKIK